MPRGYQIFPRSQEFRDNYDTIFGGVRGKDAKWPTQPPVNPQTEQEDWDGFVMGQERETPKL